MRTTHRTLFVTILLAALILCAATAGAQLRIVGAISGTITDPSGAPVPNAKVSLKDEGTGITKEATSGGDGTFLFPDLAHGLFEVTVGAPGFQTTITPHINVAASQTTDLPIRLQVGQQSQSITIEGTAPVLETTSQLVTTTQTTKSVNELPLGARDALTLARLVPGASPPNGGSTRYNNLPGGAVNVTVDGINDASNGFKSGGTVFYMTVPVRLGALEEISVETGGLGADSGAQSGANIKFITKRGTAQYHGSVFYQPQSEQFNANSWSRNATGLGRTYNRNHWFGGNIGGKLVPFGFLKNKLFFFLNYEYRFNPQTSPATITVLTPEAEAGNYTYLVNGTTNQLARVNVLQIAGANGAPTKLDPVVQSILAVNAKIPQFANQLPSGNDFNHTTWTWSQENNLYQYFPTTRFDYYITPTQQLTFSWNYYHSWQVGARRLPVPEINRSSPFRLGYFVWSAALQSTFTPTLLNEFRYGVQHSGDSNASATADYGAYYSFNSKPLRIGGTLPFGPTVPYTDQQNVTGRHFITTAYDTLTKIQGKHTLTAGFSFRSTDWKDTAEVFPIPTYATGTPSGDPLPSQLFTAANLPGVINTDTGNASGATNLYNLLTGRVASSSLRTVVDPDKYQYGGPINFTWTRSYMGGIYLQDRWRVTPQFTLNMGLRWEAQGDMYDVKGITAVPDIKSIYGPSTSLFTPGVLSGNNDPTASVGRHPYPPDYKNLAPNIGFSWNPNATNGLLGKLAGGSKTVLRGSYGITYYDEGTQMFAGNLGPNFGKQATSTLNAGQSILPTFTTLNDIVNSPPPNGAFTFPSYNRVIHQSDLTFTNTMAGMNPNLRAPYTINWTIGIQRELVKNTVLEVRYVGNQAHRPWRTSNLNEVNIFENGFLDQFKSAQRNLTINQANARGATFQNNGLAGQVNLPIFDAAFGPRGSVPAIAAASGYTNSTFIANLQNGEAGALANTLATNQNYVCRMFGSSFAPCARVPVSATQQYNAPGVYPINFFMLNPYVAGRLPVVEDSGWNSYNGLQVQLRKQFSRGLTWNTNYTWSKSLTNLPADNAQQSIDWTTQRDKTQDRRPSPFDIRHVIQTFGTYDLPIGKGRKLALNNKVLDIALGGWTAGSIIVWSTGQPVSLSGQYQTVNNNNNSSSGVILAPGVTLDQISDAFHGVAMQRLTGRAGATDQQRLAVSSDFVGPDGRANPKYISVNTAPGQWGQFLYLYGKNNFSWDASMTKNFKFTERMSFQLYGSATNIMNHPTWGLGNTSVFSTSFGVVGAPSGSRSITVRGTLSF